MNVFRDLYVSASAETMAAAVAAMENALPSGWVRDRNAEDEVQSFVTSTKWVTYCFLRKREGRRPAARLILAQKGTGTFYVSNIIPIEQHQLEPAEYNDIFEDFYEHIFKPYAKKAGLEHTVTGAEAGLERWMDAQTADLLRTFSGCANRGTGASHPNDREKWNAFVLSAHQTDSKLDPSTLARWLVETENWSPEIAEQLALEYKSGLDLLAYASSH